MWDSGVSRDEPLGSASLNLEMALENSIQVSFGRGTWGLLSYRGGDRVLISVSERLTPPPSCPTSPTCPFPHTGPLVAAGGRGNGRGARNVVGWSPH